MILTMRLVLLALVVHMLGKKAEACVVLPVIQEPEISLTETVQFGGDSAPYFCGGADSA